MLNTDFKSSFITHKLVLEIKRPGKKPGHFL